MSLFSFSQELQRFESEISATHGLHGISLPPRGCEGWGRATVQAVETLQAHATRVHGMERQHSRKLWAAMSAQLTTLMAYIEVYHLTLDSL
jgi:hypothetical protein